MPDLNPEGEMAAQVIEWLADMGWTTYTEVTARHSMRRADIVAVRGPVLWVVECKMALGVGVVMQADAWRRSTATHVSVATRYRSPYSSTTHWLRDLCRERGIGVLEVHDPRHVSQMNPAMVTEVVAAPTRRRPWRTSREWEALANIADYAAAPGNNRGEFWSPYRQTCHNLFVYVARHEGCTLKEAVESVTHHYNGDTSARSALAGWLKAGSVPGVELRKVDNRLRLYRRRAEG